MNLLIGIGAWFKTHVVTSIIIGTIVMGGAVATPIIINYYQEEQPKQEEKDNSNNEDKQPKQVTCEEGFYNRDNKCVSTDEVYNLNDNIRFVFGIDTYSKINKKCADTIVKYDCPWLHGMCIAEILEGMGFNPETKCFTGAPSNEVLDEINKRPGYHVYADKMVSVAGPYSHEGTFAAIGSLNFKDKSPMDPYPTRADAWTILARDYQLGIAYVTGDNEEKIDEYINNYKTEYVRESEDKPRYRILNEEICKDYNLNCGRW